MNSKFYKWCAVSQCFNTSIKTPNKLFVHVPKKKTMRYKWLNLARRDPTAICLNSAIYFCEDHFDLSKDMENYMEYHVMGTVSQVRMKPDCFPTKFEWQSDRTKRLSKLTELPYVIKKHRKLLIDECEKYIEERNISTQPSDLETTSGNSVFQENTEILSQEKHMTTDKSIQVYMTHKFRSKAIQTGIKFINQMTSPIKPNVQPISTSPFKIGTCRTSTNPSTTTSLQLKRKLFTIEGNYESDTSYTPSIKSKESLPSSISHLTKSTSDCSELLHDDKKQVASKILEYTLLKIMKNPHSYIGVPKDCYYLIGLIEENKNIPASHILMCLKKIRLNYPFRQLADDFAINSSYASKIFLKTIPLLASFMHPFIVKLNKDSLKQTLPMEFRHKYHYVCCIIDCLEIEIQKPSKALNQALTWSEYKRANTVKYLVSCTPNGLVNYISPGYGGRITDTCLVESSDFIKCLQPGMSVMADRGFKHVQSYLLKHGVKLVRPPSVQTGVKLSKTEARETKQIASLRIHVERVIRRLREFSILKPHACINHNLVKILDDIIIAACGLINLQDSLIK